MKILVITEQREGKWNKVSFETLAAAQQIASQAKASISERRHRQRRRGAWPTNSPARSSTKCCSSSTTCSNNTRPTDLRSRCAK